MVILVMQYLLRKDLVKNGSIFQTTSDTETNSSINSKIKKV